MKLLFARNRGELFLSLRDIPRDENLIKKKLTMEKKNCVVQIISDILKKVRQVRAFKCFFSINVD